MDANFVDSNLFNYLLLPLMIFFARIMDVTVGTIRIVMVSKGKKNIAPILGFFEVFIWILAMSKIIQNLDNWVCYIFYAGGFAAGNFIGLIIEEKLAVGTVQLQIITRMDSTKLINALKSAGYGITHHNAEGATGKWVSVIYSIVKRNDLNNVAEIIKQYNPNAFYSIADVKFVNRGITVPPDALSGIRMGK
ncbi:DUF2179 domain-containing protein [Prolixibacter sp. SD074]|jgi:uncharacterized protein YebE (UPF0316 family)|uniref:DUF2179 domain-containing protein n=1 Tax=Prolixibacter sp. SD074 TaxID=2652391 RepID=UPI001272E6E6|nr:DUF2179 domain-containing protein [Prolixibacter sp. SD074]GET28259.1 UPF0316 protein [Prolixibacter sp. SD074]